MLSIAKTGSGMLRTNESLTNVGNLDRQVPPDKPIRLAWLDESGHVKCSIGRCIDVSSRRIHVEVAEQIPLHTRVMLRTHGLSTAGATWVKYITRCKNTFILVLDFRD